MPTITPTAVADGELPHGSFDVTILETGNNYIADSFSGTESGKVIGTNNKQGNPRRSKIIRGKWTGNCDLQIESRNIPRPAIGHSFVADEDGDGNPEPFFVSDSGYTFTADDVLKCKAGIFRADNPLIYGSAIKTTAQLAAGLTYVSAAAITAFTLAAYLPAGVVLAANPWSAVRLPTGLSIAAATGIISGTPTVVGQYNVRVKCLGNFAYVDDAGVQQTETRPGVRDFTIIIT